jgi:TatA/E family protein of Tat protein translocase
MFSIPHLVIIFVVVLVVFGPEKLPELARNIGRILGEFRRATGDLQSTFEGHLRDIERESSLRHTSTGASATIAPAVQNTPAQPNAESASAPGTVPSDAPHGWTAASPNASASENGGTAAATSAETPGATQGDAAHLQPDAVNLTQEKPGQSSAAAAPEPGHEKVSDGGHPN